MSAKTSSLLLASGSAIRAKLLRDAGLQFDVQSVGVDEGEIKKSLLAEGAHPEDIALTLAEIKAMRAQAKPGQYVIGADQVLFCQGRLYDKPVSRQNAKEQLLSLRDHSHQLISAVCVVKDNRMLWHHIDTAELVMRNFSDAFLDAYIDQCKDVILTSVGAYQVEGQGIQLFRQIKGDYFTILGLPLLPLLDFIRLHGCITT